MVRQLNDDIDCQTVCTVGELVQKEFMDKTTTLAMELLVHLKNHYPNYLTLISNDSDKRRTFLDMMSDLMFFFGD